jgi:excisionase family DNA binding protein
MEKVKNEYAEIPVLFPYEPEEFWKRLRELIREELQLLHKEKSVGVEHSVPGLDYKPLYKMEEVCAIFSVTRPTIYDWIKHGKLKPFKVRSRVYFLWKDIQTLLS